MPDHAVPRKSRRRTRSFPPSPNKQVPSGEDERVVGYEDPAVHQVFWFKLRKGDLAYVPKIDKYFALQKIA